VVTNTLSTLDAWLSSARERVRGTPLAPVAEQVGRVETIADGIALISGLPGVRLGELVRFAGGQVGFATTLDRNSLSCVLLDEPDTWELPGHREMRGTGYPRVFGWHRLFNVENLS
jgi:F-type H+-transporting ATPase subunit alpha